MLACVVMSNKRATVAEKVHAGFGSKTNGEVSFTHYAPRLWTSLPDNLQAADTVEIFRTKLKASLFSLGCVYRFILVSFIH